MKKFIYILLAAFVAACSSGKDGPKTLVLGVETDYPPYCHLNESGEPVGFDIDIASELAARLGRKLVIKQMGWDALLIALKQGKIDLLMSGLSITPEREKEIALVPYQADGVSHFVSLFLQESLPLEGKIAVLRGSTMQQWADRKGLSVLPLDTISETVMSLRYGKVASALLEPHSAEEALTKLPNLKEQIVPLEPSEKVAGMGIGIRHENSELVSLVTQTIEKMREEGLLLELEQTWFGGKK